MYTVYVLQSNKKNFYKGMTKNIERRLREHRLGHTKTTSRMKDLKLVYKEEYDNFRDARAREKYFKTAAGRRFLKAQLEERA